MNPIAGWLTGLNGSPISGYSFEDRVVLNFSSPEVVCTQAINLNLGWNLISLDLKPNNNRIRDIFDNLIANDNLELVFGFDQGATTYQPNFSWSTLYELKDGFGYWVKVQNPDVLTIEGVCLDDDFRKPLDAGWNLIAYPPGTSQLPETYFADLISSNNLEFVQGFHNEIVTFDPSLPPFLNTLQEMKNGFGYWVKITNAVD